MHENIEPEPEDEPGNFGSKEGGINFLPPSY